MSLAIHRPGSSDVLLVQRPPDDEDLPLAWGLPAASLSPGETWADAVRRAAGDKLGLRVEPGVVLGEGGLERPSYRLEMRLYAARIVAGEPDVRRDVVGVTRYAAWRWGPAAELTAAAARGSLCGRLYLEWAGLTPS